jgi:hypothetical protein
MGKRQILQLKKQELEQLMLEPQGETLNWSPKNGRHEVCKFDFLEGL